MVLIIGTTEGVYLAPEVPFDEPELVLESGDTLNVLRFDDDVYAAGEEGLFRSRDGGESWTDLELPQGTASSVLKTDDALYAGSQPATIYRSTDDGETWTELPALKDVPEAERWFQPGPGKPAHVRDLKPAAGMPDGLLAGVEIGGLYRSSDGGESWSSCHEMNPDGSAGEWLTHDIHHILRLGPDKYVVSCGFFQLNQEWGTGGIYYTEDRGNNWTRLDEDLDRSYFRESFEHDGMLYAGGAKTDPPGWDDPGPGGALYEATDGLTFEQVPYPGEPDVFVKAFTTLDDVVVAGTWDDWAGTILYRTEDGWEHGGDVPIEVRSLVGI